MKRRAIQLVVLLLLGAIVNVAVAWGFATFASFKGNAFTKQEYELDYGVFWAVTNESAIGASRLSSAVPRPSGQIPEPRPPLKQVLPTFPSWCRYPQDPPQKDRDKWQQYVAGWPLYSVWAGFPPNGKIRSAAIVYEGGIDIGSGQHPDPISSDLGMAKLLPFRPLWPGFAINTIFYAAILWLLYFAPGALRRTIRRRHGMCPACAYPVGTSPVCTECGKQLA